MENELEHFGTPCSEPEIKIKICDCGAEVQETHDCFCELNKVCEECGDKCIECGKMFHTECLVEDLEGYKLCQPCFDTILQKAAKYDKAMWRITAILVQIQCLIEEAEIK